ncbi:hypothetical protein G6045_31015 [Streptomyces sp. YC504]|uniref:WxL domain-containing protein n=1 Tax=Streptomyces mesophilus TaxID=1775132 RepID=A0A6G4XR66_9ACTN|nr:hypothetical protein [Streptomyces mesophilus]NGO80055.1 hypothetical protein [Streptomyces mesophilus]
MPVRRPVLPRRLAAATVFGLLLSTGAAGAAESPGREASAAQGVTTEPTVECRLPAGQGDKSGRQTITVRITPAEVAPGGTVHVEVDLGPSPATSPLALDDAPFTAGIEFALSGGADGTVTVFGRQAPVDVPLAPERIQVPSYEGDFMMPPDARGPVRLTPTRTLTVTHVLDRDFETPCAVRSGADAIGTVDVKGEPRPAATLTAADRSAVPGAVIGLSGMRWTPGSAPRALLCGQDGTGCSPAKFARTALEVAPDGRLSGTVTLAGRDVVPAGDHQLRIFDGAREATAPLGIRDGQPAPDDPSPDPSRPADSFPGGTGGPGSSGGDAPTVDDPSSPASEHADRTPPPEHGSGGAQGRQHLATYITPGPLAMTQAGDAVDFGSLDLGQQSTATGALNTVTVSDGRGRNIGWSLTATLTNLTNDNGGTIPAGSVTWSPSCTAQTGSVGRPIAGTPGPLGAQASSLCTMGHHMRTPMTGGKFKADATLSLTLPGFVPPGEYSATLQLTLL